MEELQQGELGLAQQRAWLGLGLGLGLRSGSGLVLRLGLGFGLGAGVAQQRAVVLVLDHAQQLGRRAGGVRHEAALA